MLDQLQKMYFSSNNDMELDNYSEQKYVYIIIQLIRDHLYFCLPHHIQAMSHKKRSSAFTTFSKALDFVKRHLIG